MLSSMKADGKTRSKHAVYLEVAPKRAFACAVDWPGWSRSGKTEEEALQALLEYGRRYAAILPRSISFTAPADAGSLDVVDRVRGNSGTEFGVPGVVTSADEAALAEDELERQRRLLRAAWRAFDAAATAAATAVLRKGPRGGGRDLTKMTAHVLDADRAYLHQLGLRYRDAPTDAAEAMRAVRDAALKALADRALGRPLSSPNAVKRPWPPRYYVRRSAWHALDHAWEIEDRAEPPD
jgi:hypothetical protein